jgi:ADP-heptose:LPS heptosyltransferase
LRPDNLLTLARDTLAFRRWARAQGFAATIDIDPGSHFSALLTRLSAAPVRAGLTQTPPAPRDALYTRTVADSSRTHLAHALLALTEAALAPPEADRSTHPLAAPASNRELPLLPLNRPSPGAARLARHKLRSAAPAFDADRHQIVLVNPNLGDPLPQRRWPAEHYSAAIRSVAACRDDVFFFLIGTRSDRTALAGLAGEVGVARCTAIGGLFEIAELPALFANCAALLSSDCGLAHFAAVTPLPTVVLFGPETPARYRPLGNALILYADRHCSPCLLPASGRQSRCRDNLCLREITPETVAGELLRCLGESAQASGSERRRATAR